MTITNTKVIYDKLKLMGLTRAQIRKLLPDWWSSEIEGQPDGIAEFCLLLSRRFSFDLAGLLLGNVIIRDAAASVAYKHRIDATTESLQISTCIATSLAQAVVSAMPQPYRQISVAPDDLIIMAKRLGNGMIGLTTLVDTCWILGIPVIPLSNLPVGIRKMDGAVIRVKDRPAIIISKKNSSRAWLAFILAHELGHIANGHVDGDGSIIDISLQEKVTYEVDSSSDQQERLADKFAFELLGGGDVERLVDSWPDRMSSVDIAVRAKEASLLMGVESGHIVLRYAFKSKRWPDSMNALSFLSEDSEPEIVLKSALKRALDFEMVADDIKEHVCQLTGIDC